MEQLLFDLSEALRWPVLTLAVVALVAALLELGGLLAELRRRRGRGTPRLDAAVDLARGPLAAGDREAARRVLRGLAHDASMAEALEAPAVLNGRRDAEPRIAKRLADYDHRCLRRLERTRILVRLGPALGLMGTLIPLSPALAGLARGDVARLTEDLRVAFSVTVAGILVGALAFCTSLVRDRLYGQDLSDVEYVVARLQEVEVPDVDGPGPASPAGLVHAPVTIVHAHPPGAVR